MPSTDRRSCQPEYVSCTLSVKLGIEAHCDRIELVEHNAWTEYISQLPVERTWYENSSQPTQYPAFELITCMELRVSGN